MNKNINIPMSCLVTHAGTVIINFWVD